MKYYKLTLLISALVSMLWFEACKDKNSPSPEAQQSGLLSKTWQVGSDGLVTLDGNDVTSYFSSFQLTIVSDMSYTTTGGNSPSPWPVSGTWGFVQNTDGSINLNQIVRNDGLVVVIEELTETRLRLSFIHDELVHDNGRSEAVSGEYVFSLENQ